MTLLFIDGFDHYTDLSAKGWTASQSSIQLTTGRFGRGSLYNSYLSGSSVLPILASSTLIVGCAYQTALGWYAGTIIGLRTAGGSDHVGVYENTIGVLLLKAAGVLVATVPYTWGSWPYIEIKTTIHPSAGSLEMRLNGATVYSASGIRTGLGASTTADRFITGFGVGNLDDLYICDGLGSTNNDFLGDCRVEALIPTGAGAETQWTPSAGANWQNVDDVPPDGDTTYNASNTIGQVDTYSMSNLVEGAGLVYGVQHVPNVRKDNAGSRAIAPVMRIGGTDYAAAGLSLGSAYVSPPQITEVSPATGVRFTISEINAMEYGVKVTA